MAGFTKEVTSPLGAMLSALQVMLAVSRLNKETENGTADNHNGDHSHSFPACDYPNASILLVIILSNMAYNK